MCILRIRLLRNKSHENIDKRLICISKLTTGFLSTRLLGVRPSIKTTLLKEPAASHLGAIQQGILYCTCMRVRTMYI